MQVRKRLLLYGFAVTFFEPASLSAETPPRATLKDVLYAALDHRAELEGLRYSLAARREGVTSAYREFEPTITLGLYAVGRRDPIPGPSFSIFQPAESVQSRLFQGELLFAQELSTGTSYRLRIDTLASTTDSVLASLNPAFAVGLELRLAQRLWKRSSIDANHDLIRAREADVLAEEALLIETGDRLLIEAAERFLDLAERREIAAAQGRALENAKHLTGLTETGIEGGSLSRLDLALAAEAEAERAADLLQAEIAVLRATLE